MSRRKRHRSHSNHERWLVSYADFITLLFAFFVVLYASSQVDKRKVGQLAIAIQVAFEGMGAFPAATTMVPLDGNKALPFSTVQAIEELKKTETGRTPNPPEHPAVTAEQADLSTMESELKEALRNEIASNQVAVHRETEGLVVSLKEFGFFTSGSTTIKSESLPALDRIASILAVRVCQLRIEGHTDNMPIHNPHIPSNWELSTARATEVVRFLIVNHRFAPERLSAAGYAQYHPIASNDTANGRAQNRRVDIVILAAMPSTLSNSAPKSGAKPSASLQPKTASQ
jgi:chemotaxis protein MotB